MPIHFARKPGLVVYLTIGDPDIEISERVAIAAIDAGADVIELGVPFSDPVADGPVIQRASERAVARHVSIRDVLAVAANVRRARPNAACRRAPAGAIGWHDPCMTPVTASACGCRPQEG